MAKALVLSEEALAAPVEQPRAAQLAEAAPPKPAPKAKKAKIAPKSPQVPLQIRIGETDAMAIKMEALKSKQTVSDFMLACFHAYMKQVKA